MADGGDIVIKKIKKGGHGHHGGAWKVAYADFVTAMMAFFLLMWLLNAASKEQLEGIADYFSPTTTQIKYNEESGGQGMFGGEAPSDAKQVKAMAQSMIPAMTPDSARDEAKRTREEKKFEDAAAALRQALEDIPEMKELAASLIIENTKEGLRIQMVDQANKNMFASGSDTLEPHAQKLLELIAHTIKDMPNQIAISGHTDATKFVGRGGYSNWELSSDRALAARRKLVEKGVTSSRLERVEGKAATDLLNKADPQSPKNRRISILLIREHESTPQIEERDDANDAQTKLKIDRI